MPTFPLGFLLATWCQGRIDLELWRIKMMSTTTFHWHLTCGKIVWSSGLCWCCVVLGFEAWNFTVDQCQSHWNNLNSWPQCINSSFISPHWKGQLLKVTHTHMNHWTSLPTILVWSDKIGSKSVFCLSIHVEFYALKTFMKHTLTAYWYSCTPLLSH